MARCHVMGTAGRTVTGIDFLWLQSLVLGVSMKLSGEHRIPAPRQTVWEGLNNPDVLKESIPGCETLEETGENELTATVKAKVGPVSAKFGGTVTLSDFNPPESYVISGEGKGGAAGFAKGSAKVTLAEDGSDTILTWEADANVGGKLAQIGSRLIDSTAKKMAGQFFDAFSKKIGDDAQANAAAGAAAPEDKPAETTPAAATPVAAPTPTETTSHPAPASDPAAGKDLPPDYGHGIPMMGWAALAATVVSMVVFIATANFG